MDYPGLGARGWLGRRKKARHLPSHDAFMPAAPRFETLEPRLLLSSGAVDDPAPHYNPRIIEVTCHGQTFEAMAGEWILRIGVGGTKDEQVQTIQTLLDGTDVRATVVRQLGMDGLVLIHTDPAIDCEMIHESLKGIKGFMYVEHNGVSYVQGAPSDGSVPIFMADGQVRTQVPAISIRDGEGRDPRSRKITFTVTLSEPADEVVTVDYTTADGTAVSRGRHNDYHARAGTLSFEPGQTSRTITIKVKGNQLAEPREEFFVDLLNPSHATLTDTRGIAVIEQDTHNTNPEEVHGNADPEEVHGGVERIEPLARKFPLYSLLRIVRISLGWSMSGPRR